MCIDAAAERGDESSLAGPAVLAAPELECRAGRFGDAAALAERGLEASTQTGERLTRSVSLFAKGVAAAYLGRERGGARVHGGGGGDRRRRRPPLRGGPRTFGRSACSSLSLGRHAEAAAALARVLAIGAAAELRCPGVLPVGPDAVEARLGAGDLDGASAVARAPA